MASPEMIHYDINGYTGTEPRYVRENVARQFPFPMVAQHVDAGLFADAVQGPVQFLRAMIGNYDPTGEHVDLTEFKHARPYLAYFGTRIIPEVHRAFVFLRQFPYLLPDGNAFHEPYWSLLNRYWYRSSIFTRDGEPGPGVARGITFVTYASYAMTFLAGRISGIEDLGLGLARPEDLEATVRAGGKIPAHRRHDVGRSEGMK